MKKRYNMTCIVGLVDGKKMYMGGDSLGVCGNFDCVPRKDPKVFKKGKVLFGYTSSFRMGQLIRFKFKVPVHHKGMDDYEYMCTDFVDGIRNCLKDNGCLKIQNNEEEIGEFLVGYKGTLYKISCDLQVGVSVDNFDACGCGESFALGSLYTNNTKDPIKKIEKALEAAERYSAGVRRPFVIISS